MKLNRTYLFITISSIALLMVLIIQVNWILQTAKIKETLFNEKANIILSRTTEALRSDKEACKKIGECVEAVTPYGHSLKIGKNEVDKIDSLFKYYMKFYNFHIDYTFVIAAPTIDSTNNKGGIAGFIYNKPLDEIGNKNGIELKLIFPEKRQYIIAEMGTLFITSVILILVVMVLFWQTILFLIKERKISEHTTEFLNNMTHEFKTPLTNIALAGKMILKDNGIQQGDKISHYSAIILEENEKLRVQVEQVLSLAALERGEIPIRKTNQDIHDLINEAVKNLILQIESKHGKVKLNLEAENFSVFGDKTHLTNAFCNLFDNAIKYSKENPEISVHTMNHDKNLLIKISDNGIGIEKEYQKSIFEKYFRVPTGDLHDVKGFGLGLAYVKKIVELHEGTIVIQSEKGKGTTFTITFPHV